MMRCTFGIRRLAGADVDVRDVRRRRPRQVVPVADVLLVEARRARVGEVRVALAEALEREELHEVARAVVDLGAHEADRRLGVAGRRDEVQDLGRRVAGRDGALQLRAP